MQFVDFLSTKTNKEVEIVKSFFNKGSNQTDKIDRAKSFLATEIDKNIGNKVVETGSKLTEEDARLFFSKIAELSDFASKAKREISSLFYGEKQSIEISGSRPELLKKAQDIIIKFSEALNKDNQLGIRKLLSDLDKTKIEIELLHSVLKSAKENKENIPFELIKDLGIETKEIGEDLSEQEKGEILEISNKNYFKIVFPNEPEKAKTVVEGLEKELFPEIFPDEKKDSVKNQRTYTLKYKGIIVAFCKFKQIPEKPDELEFTSVNVSSELQGLNIGEYFISKVLETESKNHIINGESFAKNTTANNLYKKQGFVMTEDYSKKYGELMFKMRMDKREFF